MTGVDYSMLVPTVVGGILALGGGLVGQMWSERAAVAREKRDRDHEREVWARDLRRQAHETFLAEFGRKFKIIDESPAIPKHDGSEPDPDFLETIFDTLIPLRLFAGNETTRRAWNAFFVLKDYAFGSATEPKTHSDVARALDEYVQSVRNEFGLKPSIDDNS
jgi:hypothetical protein